MNISLSTDGRGGDATVEGAEPVGDGFWAEEVQAWEPVVGQDLAQANWIA